MDVSLYSVFKLSKPGLFLFILVLFEQHFAEKTLDYCGIQTQIVGVEGEHADLYITTTSTDQCLKVLTPTSILKVPRARV